MTASVLLAAFALPFVLSFLGTALLIRIAPRLGLIDQPSERKVHTTPTPRGGGLAIFAAMIGAGVCYPDLLWWRWGHVTGLLLLGCSLLIVVLGLLDDWYSLSWQLRLGTQTAVAAVAVYLCLEGAAWPLQVVTVFWVVAMTNAFNMLDNMDALSAGVAWIAAGFLGLASWLLAPTHLGTLALVPWLLLMGAVLGFLCFNRPPARIFMGDSGSTFLGFFLGLGCARLATWEPAPSWSCTVPLALLAVPCYDMTSVVFLRLKQGRSPFHADKQHLSHRLVERGLSNPAAVGVIYLLALASGATGLLLLMVTTPLAAGLAGGALVMWWVAFAVVEWLSVRRT